MRKNCIVCGPKDVEEFHKNPAKPDGLRDRCKACAKIYHRKHYEQNKLVYIENAKKNRQLYIEETRAWMDELKSKPCIDCGNKFHPVAMDFDHVRGVKEFDISTAVNSRKLSKERLLIEIEKCELVCACCHRIRTWRRSIDVGEVTMA